MEVFAEVSKGGGGGVRAGARLEAGASCELGGSWSLFNVFSVS